MGCSRDARGKREDGCAVPLHADDPLAEDALIHVAARALLGPVLLAQARRLRRGAPELPEASGPREGAAGTGRQVLRLLVAGDSSAAGVGAPTQDQALAGHLAAELAHRLCGRVNWQLVAATGARSEDVVDLLKRSRLRPADVGVVVVGVNDITKEVPLERAMHQRGAAAAVMRRRAGVRQVFFPALPEMEKFPALPQPLAWYAGRHARVNNAAQAAWARGRDGIAHVPMDGVLDASLMADDGFHPGPGLYARVAQRLAAYITEGARARLDDHEHERGTA